MTVRVSVVATKAARLESLALVIPVTAQELSNLGTVKKNSSKKSSKKAEPYTLASFDQATNGLLLRVVRDNGFKGTAGESLVVPIPEVNGVQYVALYGYGVKDESFGVEESNRLFGNFIVSIAKRFKLESVAVNASNLRCKGVEAQALGEGLVLGQYSYTKFKSSTSKKGASPEESSKKLAKLFLVGASGVDERALQNGIVIGEATAFSRDLINLPPNECTPSHLAAQAKELGRTFKFSVDVFDRKVLQKMGANSLLAVALGSDQPPFLIRMVLKPKKKSSKVIGIVGKGVTFDSGGLSIKPSGSMEDMKNDMSGAAAVLGAMRALAQLNPNVEVRGYVPTTENMINGHAMRLGDVFRAMNGKTIEVMNTDAEGRMILADALCLAEKDGCQVIVDLATLTGACVVALGEECAAVFTDDDRLASDIARASVAAGERTWRMPLLKQYRKLFDSSVADMKNTGGRWGGAITAALFLKEFVTNPKTRWAHIDIAGPAFVSREQGYIKQGGTGFGVRTVVNLVRGMK